MTTQAKRDQYTLEAGKLRFPESDMSETAQQLATARRIVDMQARIAELTTLAKQLDDDHEGACRRIAELENELRVVLAAMEGYQDFVDVRASIRNTLAPKTDEPGSARAILEGKA